MKKTAFIIMLMLSAAFVITGCAGIDKGLLGDIKPSIAATRSPKQLGKTAGQGAYLAYVVCKNNPKYDKEVAMCEETWQKLVADDGTVTIADINNLAIQMGSAAVADKYGWVYGAAMATGMQAAGAFADNAIAGKFSKEEANQFFEGLVEGVRLMQATIPADALIPAEKEKKVRVFDCPDGNCTVTAGSRDVKFQQRMAQQIIDDGYADKDEVVKEGHNAYTNCKDLVTRCKMLRKYKVSETRCYIHHFTVKDGKLAEIEFRMIGNESEFKTICVSCEAYLELEDREEEIEY